MTFESLAAALLLRPSAHPPVQTALGTMEGKMALDYADYVTQAAEILTIIFICRELFGKYLRH
jgi:hypothetical protein